MKKLIFLMTLFASSIAFAGDVWVHGYYRKDGTYVAPHWRSAPDGNVWNNWSTKGNVNPYTGQPGYKDPLSSSSGIISNHRSSSLDSLDSLGGSEIEIESPRPPSDLMGDSDSIIKIEPPKSYFPSTLGR